jgi:hypothetical protein
MQLGVAYCVLSVYAPGYSTAPTPTGPPGNLAAGSFSNCTVYHTVASGDTCNSMEVAANISATDLLRWNPEVNVTSCTNIQLGAAYCVGGGGEFSFSPVSRRFVHRRAQGTSAASCTPSRLGTTAQRSRPPSGLQMLSSAATTLGSTRAAICRSVRLCVPVLRLVARPRPRPCHQRPRPSLARPRLRRALPPALQAILRPDRSPTARPTILLSRVTRVTRWRWLRAFRRRTFCGGTRR